MCQHEREDGTTERVTAKLGTRALRLKRGESVALRDVVDAAADGRTLVLRKRDQREARRFLGFGIDASVVVKEPNELILVVNIS